MNTLARAVTVTALGAALIGGPMAAAPMASAAPAKTIAVTKTVVPTPAQKAALEKKKQAFLTKMRNYSVARDRSQAASDVYARDARMRLTEAARLEGLAANRIDKIGKTALLKMAATERKSAKSDALTSARHAKAAQKCRAGMAKLQATVGTPNGWVFTG